ncbi:hydroxymethylglutaryl-CoA lyase [Haloactinomyces albus]|uniref:Hydroxymethylglutaryl-CoA lyase n=1 Tax=Haloactinomyces albus TaxID=1352928 RepID=A0AAE3ZFM4_9ACTN|nr:hydroxymethylglutaryl-CoA lyase [Haloactinomyces albus]MDR7304068.1 hydroxymethylglutaryl-CoA lyase [Haloactinomyces albus]
MDQTAVILTDVVLRDGLQDEPVVVSVHDRLALAGALAAAGLRSIEAASFVNPNRVPQMSGAEELVAALPHKDSVRYSALALNARGIARAAAAGAEEITVVTSASQGHSQANSGRSVDDALADVADVVAEYPSVTFAAGIATAFVCPFDGEIAPEALLPLTRRFTELGVTRIGLADTIGTAAPEQVVRTLDVLRSTHPDTEFSLHLHNAHGQALRTVDAALELGITRFDSAAGGYGGCPFAPGAHGNIATEDLVAHLHSRGIPTGIDESALADAITLVKQALTRARTLT